MCAAKEYDLLGQESRIFPIRVIDGSRSNFYYVMDEIGKKYYFSLIS